MPELPEIASRTKEMQSALIGKMITDIEVVQPKSLNVSQDKFKSSLVGSTINEITYHGKWIFVETSKGWLLLNLGMGGEILLVTRDTLPEKYRLVFDFDDSSSLSVNFWWFGYAHFMPLDELNNHQMTAKLGPNALDLDAGGLGELLAGRRGRIKSFLLDQSRIAGIGNAYIHDILFLARLHPLRPVNTMSDKEIDQLHKAIRDGLQPSLEKGGAWYEVDLYGNEGGFTREDIIIGYREGEPCPNCGTEIVKIKTGSTSSFICPIDQVEQ